MREHHFELESTTFTADTLVGFDCALIATNHGADGYELIRRHAELIVDTRRVYMAAAPSIVQA